MELIKQQIHLYSDSKGQMQSFSHNVGKQKIYSTVRNVTNFVGGEITKVLVWLT